ncbi:MAG: TIGR01777 family oxidoreductase [Bacteroidota bacterium]
MAVICITGGNGMIGKQLTDSFTKNGHEVIILTRRPQKDPRPLVIQMKWDISSGFIDPEALVRTEVIIHLAGANVAEKRWTKSRKEEIVSSRTESGRLLVKALQSNPNKVRTIISASAIGWYGPDHGKIFSEDMPHYPDFLGETCKKWEESLHPVRNMGIRLVTLRIGIVLSHKGGALREFRKPVQFGIAPILGNGKQIISWIHIDDLCRIFEKSMTDTNMHGIYNATAPQPISNKDFMLTLAKSMKKFFIPIHVPAFALKIALGEMSIEVLKSCTVSSSKIQQTDFQFIYPSLESALNQLNR